VRLDFRVLWIDDQPRHVKSFVEGLQLKLNPLGFNLVVSTVESVTDVDSAIGHDIHDDAIDLVLVDYELGASGTGDAALTKIRAKFPHKDILFYSAGESQKLRQIAYEAGLDGIYFATRLTLVNDTFGLIESILSKVMDIDHMRGVVMSATSDIDFLVEESVLAVYARLEGERKQKFVDSVVAECKKKLGEWGKALGKAEQTGTLEAVFKLHYVCTAAVRLKLLLSSLSAWEETESTHLNMARAYRDDVVPRRNRLAHTRLQDLGGRLVLVGESGPITAEEMRQLRCDLIEHRVNFQDIAVLIDVPLT
jgi:hypothetical protein